MVSSLRSSQLEVLVDRCEWHRVNVSLEETALVLSPLGDGFVDLASAEISGEWAVISSLYFHFLLFPILNIFFKT